MNDLYTYVILHGTNECLVFKIEIRGAFIKFKTLSPDLHTGNLDKVIYITTTSKDEYTNFFFDLKFMCPFNFLKKLNQQLIITK